MTVDIFVTWPKSDLGEGWVPITLVVKMITPLVLLRITWACQSVQFLYLQFKSSAEQK